MQAMISVIARTERLVAFRLPCFAEKFLCRNPANGSVRKAKMAPVISAGSSGRSMLAVRPKQTTKNVRGRRAVGIEGKFWGIVMSASPSPTDLETAFCQLLSPSTLQNSNEFLFVRQCAACDVENQSIHSLLSVNVLKCYPECLVRVE